jgi:uncharacterized membrane protein (UPF0127 family)
MVLRNANTGQIIATRIGQAATFVERAVGLIGRPNLRPDEGIWLDKCSAIHTVGMRSAIDVIFLDRDQQVVRICPGVGAFRWAVVCPGASSVVELGPGALALTDILLGDRLELLNFPTYTGHGDTGVATAQL